MNLKRLAAAALIVGLSGCVSSPKETIPLADHSVLVGGKKFFGGIGTGAVEGVVNKVLESKGITSGGVYSGGGSQTPWTSNIDAAGFVLSGDGGTLDLDDTGTTITFTTDFVLTDGTDTTTFSYSSGDTKLTPGSGEQLILAEDGGSASIVIQTTGLALFQLGARLPDNDPLNFGTGDDAILQWAGSSPKCSQQPTNPNAPGLSFTHCLSSSYEAGGSGTRSGL